MNPKLIFAASGAVLIPVVAVPASISLTPSAQEDLVGTDKEKATQATQATQATPKVSARRKHSSLKGSPKKSNDTDEGYYVSKYQDYFLSSNQDQGLWEEKFNKFKDPSSEQIKIVDYDDDEDDYLLVATISKPWDTNHNDDRHERNMNFPLNVFCGKWYKEDGWASDEFWTFHPSSNSSFSGIGASHLWRLCSAFDSKPKTIDEDKSQLRNPYSDSRLIGNKLKKLVMSINNNDAFWEIREEEWKALKSHDSTYFEYQEDKSIKDLCGDAYKKEPSQDQDSSDSPTLENVKKYCRLEWNF